METRFYDEVSQLPAAVRLRYLLIRARAMGLKLGFLADAERAEAGWSIDAVMRGMPRTPNDPENKRAFFRILANLMEHPLVGLSDSIYFSYQKPL